MIRVVALSSFLVFLATSSLGSAAIVDFNNGTGWTSNGGATLGSTSATLTTATPLNQARTIFHNTKQDITSFTASFKYDYDTTASTNNPADGFAFIIQNQSLTALGGSGSSFAISGITPSVAITFGINSTDTTTIGTNGSRIGLLNSANVTASNPLMTDLDLTTITINYDGTNLSFTVTKDADPNIFFTRSVAANLPSLLSGSTAWIGFAGATGARVSDQVVSNFSFTPIPEPSTVGLALLGGCALLVTGLRRVRKCRV